MPQEWQIWIISQFTRVFSVILRIGVLVVLAYAAQRLGRGLIARSVRVLEQQKPEVPDYRQRLQTLEQILIRTLAVVVYLIAGLMILRELGFNITPLLAGAGILGLALSIGAQFLVRDFLTGLVVLIEDQFRVGDQVNINGHEGRVERITPRTVWLRDDQGAVHIIPFSAIQIVENRTASPDSGRAAAGPSAQGAPRATSRRTRKRKA